MRMLGLGHGLFAAAAVGVALYSLAYGDLAAGGQSWPAWMPWREALAHGVAILVLLAGVGLCFARTALPSALIIGAYYAIWTLIGVPAIFSDPLSVGAWYGVCEALTALAGAWLLYVLLRWEAQASGLPTRIERSIRVAQVVFGLICVFYGWSHFKYADYTASMVPTWLPARMGFAYLTGLGHIAAGVGLALGILPRLAATLEAIMMSLFGLLVWVPSFFTQPRPTWATPPQNQWSELVITVLVAASAWVVARSLAGRPWTFAPRSSA